MGLTGSAYLLQFVDKLEGQIPMELCKCQSHDDRLLLHGKALSYQALRREITLFFNEAEAVAPPTHQQR